MKHIMVDLETMGNGPTAAMVSFGAVEFDPTICAPVILGRCFYRNVDLQSCIDVGLTVDASTVYWWLEQSEAARSALLPDKESIQGVLYDFNKFWADVGAETIWAHGTSFDIAILKTAYRNTKIKQPFAYNADRDTRSTFDQTGWPSSKTQPGQLEHHALDDAKAQAIQVCEAFHRMQDIKGGKSTLVTPTAPAAPKCDHQMDVESPYDASGYRCRLCCEWVADLIPVSWVIVP